MVKGNEAVSDSVQRTTLVEQLRNLHLKYIDNADDDALACSLNKLRRL